MNRFIAIFFLIPLSDCSFAQTGHTVYATISGSDTIPYILLDAVEVSARKPHKLVIKERKWNKLRRDILKVYPYARSAATRLQGINDRLAKITDEKEKKEYLKSAESNLFGEYADDLKKLTFKQGYLLVRLIDREAGQSTYTIVNELKGKGSAIFWQALARIFGSNLKWEYDAEEQKDIEMIIHEIENGQLAMN